MKAPEPRLVIGHEMKHVNGGVFIPYAWECAKGNLRVLGNSREEAKAQWDRAIQEGDLP
jgi:hypothetical protein